MAVVDVMSMPLFLGSDSHVLEGLQHDAPLDTPLTRPSALNMSLGKGNELCMSYGKVYAEPAEPLVVAPKLVSAIYQPTFVAPRIVYTAIPSTSVYAAAPTIHSSPPISVYTAAPTIQSRSSILLPQEPTSGATYMWNGTEYASYDAAVEAMTVKLIPNADIQESNAEDVSAESNLDCNVEAPKPWVYGSTTKTRVVHKKKGCC